ncbi:MAG: hypothetical protein AB7S75_10215 [Desulfococcaceae bacterium]
MGKKLQTPGTWQKFRLMDYPENHMPVFAGQISETSDIFPGRLFFYAPLSQ